jgi:hypothetical protein
MDSDTKPNPTIGRIVHIILENGLHAPGIVTRVVDESRIHLDLFLGGVPAAPPMILQEGVPYRDPGERVHPKARYKLTWHWPERDDV